MPFSKSFPKKVKGYAYPQWVEIFLTEEEELKEELFAREKNIMIMKECLDDAKKLIQTENLKRYQTDLVNLAISLFEKRASHVVYFKERKSKEKFDN